jgi:hypothetical protein
VSRAAIHEWRVKGSENPDRPYGKFFKMIEWARDVCKIAMVKKLRNDPDWRATWKLMKNGWPGEFSERIISEISGPNGSPIPVDTTARYTVKITCSQPFPEMPIMPMPAEGNENGQARRCRSP